MSTDLAESTLKSDFPPAPTRMDEVLDPAWLTAALRRRFPDITVHSVTVTETLVTMATKIRLTIDATSSAGDAPSAICIKAMLGEDAPQLVARGVSRIEALFYRECASNLPLHLPRCLYAAVDPANNHGLIIMDDVVAGGAHFLSALNPYSSDDAVNSLEQLAILHVHGGDGGAMFRLPWVPSFLDRVAAEPLVPLDMLQELLDGPRGDPLPKAILDARRLQAGIVKLAERVRNGPLCLVHGDAHAGNLYRDAHGFAIVDWQVLQRGHWAQDVAYHLGAVLSPEDRRAHERDLLGVYLDHLARLGGPRISVASAWSDYRVAMLYGYYLWAVTRKVAPDIMREFVRRLGLAVVDHDSFGLLE